ncbi:unnamed protein product [Arctogadus glacialis]
MAPTCFLGRGMSIQQATDLWPAAAVVSICLECTLLLVINITRTPLPSVSPRVKRNVASSFNHDNSGPRPTLRGAGPASSVIRSKAILMHGASA